MKYDMIYGTENFGSDRIGFGSESFGSDRIFKLGHLSDCKYPIRSDAHLEFTYTCFCSFVKGEGWFLSASNAGHE